LIVAATASGIALLLGSILWGLGERGDISSDIAATASWGLVLLPAIAIGGVLAGALQGMGRVALGQAQELLVRPMMVGILATITAMASPLSASGAMSLTMIGTVFSVFTAAALVLHLRPQCRTLGRPQPNWDWATACPPLLALALMQILNLHLGVILTGMLAPASDAGVLRAVMQASTVMATAIHAIGSAMGPTFARLYQSQDGQELRRAAKTAVAMSLVATVPAVLIAVCWGELVLGVAFGAAFSGGATALTLVALGRAVQSSFGAADTLLIMTGNERVMMTGLAVGTALNVLLGVALIPSFGVNGAAAASAISLAAWNVLAWRAVRMKLKIDTSILGFTRSRLPLG
jgi:O-antigen/teichoic acid export membrane protein